MPNPLSYFGVKGGGASDSRTKVDEAVDCFKCIVLMKRQEETPVPGLMIVVFWRLMVSRSHRRRSYAAQEKRLNVFHLRCLRRILSISWQDHIANSAVLERAGILSVYTLLRQRRLRWIGHVHRMDEGRIPKQLLYGELAQGKRPVGRPKLSFKDVAKRDMQAIGLPIDSWETLGSDRSAWKTNCTEALQ